MHSIFYSIMQNMLSCLILILINYSINYLLKQSIKNEIKAIYESCTRDMFAIAVYPINYRADFKNLEKDGKYIVSIIPIVDSTNIKTVNLASIPIIVLATIVLLQYYLEPNIPQNISILSKSLNQIVIYWDKQNETNQFGIGNQYLLLIRNSKSQINKSKQVCNERIKVTNLEICTQYCFTLSSQNNAGSSEWSKEICTYTLAPGKIIN